MPGRALVGDLRSAREPDVGILSQLSNPLFVHAGGIDPVLALLASSPLTEENLYSGERGSDIIIQPGRVAPYATFVNTASLWAFDPADTTPPAPDLPVLGGTAPGRGGRLGSQRPHPFSSSSDVTWQWNPAAGYLRFYSGAPDILLDGTQTAATNVVIMTVPTVDGPWVENSRGRPRGRRHRHRHGSLVVMRTAGHRRHLEPVQPDRAGHPDRHRWDADHPAARQHLGGTGARGIPVTPRRRPRRRRRAAGPSTTSPSWPGPPGASRRWRRARGPGAPGPERRWWRTAAPGPGPPAP